jgi:hypothetical protein
MATDLHSPPDQQTVTGIITGIINDFQRLMTQQIDMVRAEIRSDWVKTKQAIWPIAVGSILASMGGLMISLMFVFLLWWATAPAGADPSRVPLWGCFGLIGSGFLIAGGAMLAAGIHKFHTFNPLPEKSAEALKENVQWLTNNK